MRMSAKGKMAFKITTMLKLIMHMALNIGPVSKANEDIELHLDDKEKVMVTELPESPIKEEPAHEEKITTP